jgi:hypothetical protein
MSRFLRMIATLLVTLTSLGSGAEQLAQTAVKRPPLRERLTFGLQARLDSEVAFIDAVVDTVNRGELPESLVDRTFFWARKRGAEQTGLRRHRRPIIYFRPALLAQTNKLDIEIAADPQSAQQAPQLFGIELDSTISLRP